MVRATEPAAISPPRSAASDVRISEVGEQLAGGAVVAAGLVGRPSAGRERVLRSLAWMQVSFSR